MRVGLRNPVRIAVKVKSANGALDKRTPASLQMSYLLTPPSHKLPALRALLTSLTPTPQKTIIYISTCAAVDYFQNLLAVLLPGFTIVPLHGKYPPNVRQKNFARFTTSVAPTVLLTTDVAARGLDIPSVDLVVQLDPPSDPKAFLHRCGRAARAGRKGLAVTFLTPGREEDYIEFLRVRQTPITPLSAPAIVVSDEEAATTTEQIREVVRADRATHDKAQKAFVSWVQAYSKHAAGSIFRVQDLEWGELGRAWGLLRLPKMPEARRWEGDRTLGVVVDWENFAYKDKAREKHRKAEMEARRAGVGEGRVKEGMGVEGERMMKKERAWSLKKDAKWVREQRREKKLTRREKEKLEKMGPKEREEREKLQRMIEEVRKRGVEEEFEGFGD